MRSVSGETERLKRERLTNEIINKFENIGLSERFPRIRLSRRNADLDLLQRPALCFVQLNSHTQGLCAYTHACIKD